MRAGVNQGLNAATGAAGASSIFANRGGAAYQTLFPFLHNELTATHTLTPQQEGELMTSAAAGAGGANSSIAGELGLRNARTRNSAGTAGVLDQAARMKDQALARTGENVAAKDVMLTQQNRQNAARGLAGLYGADTSGMLRSMGLIPQDINAASRANDTGWFQNVLGLLKAGNEGGAGVNALAKLV